MSDFSDHLNRHCSWSAACCGYDSKSLNLLKSSGLGWSDEHQEHCGLLSTNPGRSGIWLWVLLPNMSFQGKIHWSLSFKANRSSMSPQIRDPPKGLDRRNMGDGIVMNCLSNHGINVHQWREIRPETQFSFSFPEGRDVHKFSNDHFRENYFPHQLDLKT